ncbi:MAG: cupin domain-containing protein [Desulfuromonadales bacterium]|nr:cupin domain-containing protein [Desulfuromonadales bacterium]
MTTSAILIANIFSNLPQELPEELFETLAQSPAVRIERILSQGHATADGQWFDQERDEWVLLLSGSAGLHFEGETAPRSLAAGDFVLIPTHCRHRVAWTDQQVQSVWLAVHFPGETTL